MPVRPSVRVCTHIKVTGIRCGSPALRGEQFCYFHQRMMRGVRTPPDARLHPIALIESEEAIQASLMEVINALARNTIDLRRAQLILRALNIAVRNARRVRFETDSDSMVHQVPDYPAPPAPDPAIAAAAALPEAPIELARAWEAIINNNAAPDPSLRKPPASQGLPAETKAAMNSKGG
ncbi:MAG TPA: hypothetical protein VJ999_05690 [Candidatus Sulfotelmatobacter sp.]|nr:hypothetical protein [Candidatus Sulfotelmatobacter sp.]